MFPNLVKSALGLSQTRGQPVTQVSTVAQNTRAKAATLGQNTSATSLRDEIDTPVQGTSQSVLNTSEQRDNAVPGTSQSAKTIGSKKRKRRAPNISTDQPQKELFANNEVVFANNNLQIEIVRTDFKKWHRFALEDSLFILKCTMKRKNIKKPLISDLFYALQKAIEKCLEKLKSSYTREDGTEHQVTNFHFMMTSVRQAFNNRFAHSF